jgi:hypothetical protein
MKSKSKFLPMLFISILLFSINQTNAQKEKKVFKAYLVVNNISEKLKSDSLFNTNLKLKVKNILKKKNYVLVPNSEMEEADRSYLYIYITISDSLKISARKGYGSDNVTVIPNPEESFVYKNSAELIGYVIQYIKKYL